jgi:hypothetical protein
MGTEKTRLEKAQEQEKQARERVKKILKTESKERRKFENRRKVLLGIMFHKLVIEGRISEQLFAECLDKYLTLDRDRKVFDNYMSEFSPHQPKA